MAGYTRRGIFMHGWGLDLTRASSVFENDCRYVLRACRVYRNARALPWHALCLSVSVSVSVSVTPSHGAYI